jgi:peptidoglycan/LPS O-acetylase OafA/YrhL
LSGGFVSIASLCDHVRLDRPTSNIAALDGLRGIAILLVLGRHAVRPFYSEVEGLWKVGGWEVTSPFINGWMGVDLFFVLSGFLITYQFLRRHERGRPFRLKDFVVRRVFRIVPVYYFVLMIVVAGLVPYYATGPVSAWEFIKHLLFLQDYGGSQIVPAFWSLGVEEKFYLVAPVVLLLIFRIRSTRVRTGILVGLLVLPLVLRMATFASHPELDQYDAAFGVLRAPFHLNLDGFLVGITLAFVFQASQSGQIRVAAGMARVSFWIGAATIGALLFVTPLADQPSWFNTTVLPSILALGFGATMFGILHRPETLRPMFGSAGLFVVAKISYPLYLIHMTLIPLTWVALKWLTPIERSGAVGQFFVFLPVFVGVSLVAALLLHFAVEKPFLDWRDRLLRKAPTPSAGQAERPLAA